MNRRDFLKIVGITTATSTAALYGCGSKEGSSEGSKVLGPIPTDKMTYRSFPGLGSDKVSILGYGCMRWPTVPAPDGKGEMIDQDAVNELVDYAIAHGVNYFDTSPMYVQGWSEKSTGIALKRHPRESFYLATKLSNFHPDTWTREGSIAMYRKSFEDMQVDYIDYYLLHMIGGGGMEQFRKRYIDNGMIDFLVKEREAGRIRRLGWSFHGDIEILHADHFVEPVFDRKKGCYHISWESFVYLVEGIVPKDRRVDFNDLDDENTDETPLEELGNRGEKTSGNKLSKDVV